MPEEYGGTNGKLQDHIGNLNPDYLVSLISIPIFFSHWKTDALIVDVEKNAVWLSKQYKHKSNEKKRPGKEILYSDLFGMEGSFRQLTVD